MSDMVQDIEYRFPERGASSFGGAPARKRPRAEVVFTLEDGASRSGWVPPRVARLFQKNEPDLPCAYRAAMDGLLALEERVCFTALTEMQSRREHSCSEARTKLLQQGFREPSVDRAIERARELKFINDTRFMTSFIDERLRRGWGRRRIEVELKHRGVDPAELPGYPEDYFSVEDDRERALALLKRKSVPETRAFEKFVRHLMGKGFSYDIAASAARARIALDEEE